MKKFDEHESYNILSDNDKKEISLSPDSYEYLDGQSSPVNSEGKPYKRQSNMNYLITQYKTFW